MTEDSSTPTNEQSQNHSFARMRPGLQPGRKFAPQEGAWKEVAPYVGGWRSGQELMKAQAKQAASTESMICSGLQTQRSLGLIRRNTPGEYSTRELSYPETTGAAS